LLACSNAASHPEPVAFAARCVSQSPKSLKLMLGNLRMRVLVAFSLV
jgi:hypothetical protein